MDTIEQKYRSSDIVERYNQKIALEEAIQNMAHAQARVIAKKKLNTSDSEVIKKLATKLVPAARKKLTQSDNSSFVSGTPIKNKGHAEYSESVNDMFAEAFPPYNTSDVTGQNVDKPISSDTTKRAPSKEKKVRNNTSIIQHGKFGEEKEVKSSVYNAIVKKSNISGINEDILGEVYDRGIEGWNEDIGVTQQQYAFARVNSFINKGKTFYNEDSDLQEKISDDREDVESVSRPQSGKRGGIKNVERKPNVKLATDPDSAHNRQSEIKKKVIESRLGNSQNDPKKRQQGTDSLVKAYNSDTPKSKVMNESFEMAFDYQGKPSIAPTANDLRMKAQSGFAHHNDVQDVMEVTSIKKQIENAFQTTVLEEDTDELAISVESLTTMVEEAFDTINRIKNSNIERDAWSQSEILKLERYIESVAAYLSNIGEEVDAADRHGEVVSSHKRVLTDPYTGKTTVVNVPGFTRSSPTNRKIIKSGNIRDGKPTTKSGMSLGPA